MIIYIYMIIYIITYIYNHIYIYTCSPSENGCHPLGPLVHWMLDQGWGHIYPEFFGQVGLVSAMGGLAFPKENHQFIAGIFHEINHPFWGTPYFQRNSIWFDHVVGLWQFSIMIVSD